MTRTEPALHGVIALLARKYGARQNVGKSRLYRFGSALTCSVNYSKLLGNHKYFFGLAREVGEGGHDYPPTDLGDLVLLVCGSADTVLVLPRLLVLEAMRGVVSRKLDIFLDDGSFILQTTKHPKLDVTQFLNAYPSYSRRSDQSDEQVETTEPADRRHVKIQWALIRLGVATSIYSGLLRLNDLVLAQPNNKSELYIAAARSRRDKVRDQLMRPSFQPLIERCQFVAFEYLEEQDSRLAGFPLDSGARVSGLVRGEYFPVPEHYAYPAGL